MLKKYSLKAFQKAINHALSLDDEWPAKLTPLSGKVLEMVIEPLGVNFYIRFTAEKLELEDQIEGKANTTIHSSPIGLIRLSLLPSSKARSLFNDNVKISGDLEFGRDVKNLFDHIDIDWEGHLSQFTGDVVAHQIGSLFRKGRSFSQRFNESMRQNLSEYLHEEFQLVPTGAELDDFFHEIDEVSLSVERLDARIQQLMATDGK